MQLEIELAVTEVDAYQLLVAIERRIADLNQEILNTKEWTTLARLRASVISLERSEAKIRARIEEGRYVSG